MRRVRRGLGDIVDYSMVLVGGFFFVVVVVMVRTIVD